MQLQVNLLPKVNRPKPAVRVWPVLLAIVLILNIIGMGAWWLFLKLDLAATATKLQLKVAEVQQLQAEVTEAESAAVLQARVEARRDFIATAISQSCSWHPLLLAVEDSMVPGITLKTLAAANSGAVVISGDTVMAKAVADFLGSLQVETGLPVVRIFSVQPGGAFQISLEGWSGREADGDE